jgi:hypothetical protein
LLSCNQSTKKQTKKKYITRGEYGEGKRISSWRTPASEDTPSSFSSCRFISIVWSIWERRKKKKKVCEATHQKIYCPWRTKRKKAHHGNQKSEDELEFLGDVKSNVGNEHRERSEQQEQHDEFKNQQRKYQVVLIHSSTKKKNV